MSPAVRFSICRTLVFTLFLSLLGCSGRGVSDEVLEKLEQGSAAERLDALHALSRSPKALDLPRLRLLLDDPLPAVRALALSIAAQRREPQVVEWVGPKVLDPDADVRRAALEALLRFDGPVRERYLIAAYPLQDLRGRKAIMDELEHRDEKLLRLIGEEAQTLWERNLLALQGGGVAELVGALELVGRSGRAEAVERLVELLGSDSTRVVVAAARGLSMSGGGNAAKEALETLAASEIPERRDAAREALARLGVELPDEEAAEVAEGEELEEEEAPSAEALWEKAEDAGQTFAERREALRELERLGGQEARFIAFARGLLQELGQIRAGSEEEEAEASAAREWETAALLVVAAEVGLAKGDRDFEKALLTLSEDPLPQLRALAVRAGNAVDIEVLQAKASNDPSVDVRLAAVEALSRREGGEISAVLATLAELPTEAGERALAELERRGDAETLVKVFRTTGSARAATALGRLGRPEAVKPLLDPAAAPKVTPSWILSLKDVDSPMVASAARLHLAHDRPEIRAAAAEVLRGRCDWGAMPLLRALAAQDYFVEVRTAAEAAVAAIRACPPH